MTLTDPRFLFLLIDYNHRNPNSLGKIKSSKLSLCRNHGQSLDSYDLCIATASQLPDFESYKTKDQDATIHGSEALNLSTCSLHVHYKTGAGGHVVQIACTPLQLFRRTNDQRILVSLVLLTHLGTNPAVEWFSLGGAFRDCVGTTILTPTGGIYMLMYFAAYQPCKPIWNSVKPIIKPIVKVPLQESGKR